jgi:hypothetical protein
MALYGVWLCINLYSSCGILQFAVLREMVYIVVK